MFKVRGMEWLRRRQYGQALAWYLRAHGAGSVGVRAVAHRLLEALQSVRTLQLRRSENHAAAGSSPTDIPESLVAAGTAALRNAASPAWLIAPGVVSYPCGCVVVWYDQRRRQRSLWMVPCWRCRLSLRCSRHPCCCLSLAMYVCVAFIASGVADLCVRTCVCLLVPSANGNW